MVPSSALHHPLPKFIQVLVRLFPPTNLIALSRKYKRGHARHGEPVRSSAAALRKTLTQPGSYWTRQRLSWAFHVVKIGVMWAIFGPSVGAVVLLVSVWVKAQPLRFSEEG